MPEDELGPLVELSRAAWRGVREGRSAADRADEAVKKFMFGKDVIIIDAYGTGFISGGTVHPRSKHFADQPARVTAVFFYYNDQLGQREEVFRIITPDGENWELPVAGARVAPVEATIADTPSPSAA